MRRVALAVVVALVACTEITRPRPGQVPVVSPPTPRDDGVAVYLTLSNANPNPGDRVVVSVRAVNGAHASAVGSFLLTVRYDSLRLRVADYKGSAEGLVAINPINGAIAAAGASATGFVTGELFHFSLDVDDPRALRTLSAGVTQLVSLKFADHRANMSLSRALVLAPAVIKP